MAQPSRKDLIDQLNSKTAELRKVLEELSNANKFIEGLQESIRTQGVSPEELQAVQDIQAVGSEIQKMVANLYTEKTPAP